MRCSMLIKNISWVRNFIRPSTRSQKLSTRFGLDPSSHAGLGVAADTLPNFIEEFLFKSRVIE